MNIHDDEFFVKIVSVRVSYIRRPMQHLVVVVLNGSRQQDSGTGRDNCQRESAPEDRFHFHKNPAETGLATNRNTCSSFYAACYTQASCARRKNFRRIASTSALSVSTIVFGHVKYA